MDNEQKITKCRQDALKRELEFLKTTRSREVEAFIAEAMSYGDLENNAEYDAAVGEQQKLAGRIAEIENILAHSVVTEERSLSEAYLAELRALLQAWGLSAKQAESYAQYCQVQFELLNEEKYGILPSDRYLETLKEAQRISAEALDDYLIDRFLRIPCDRWQAAKAAIMESFGCSEEAVRELYNENTEWLTVQADDVFALADYLESVLSDKTLSWKIFRKGALGGESVTKSRISAVLDMLGEETGKKVIRTDAENNIWLFYPYYSDPVECIAYMAEQGLTPEKILSVIAQDPDILYFYKKGRRLSYGHNQQWIDRIIRKYK